MNSQADTLYKQLFAHTEMLRELLTGFLEADWAASLSVGAFERVNASYASDQGKARHDDMVWRVNVGGDLRRQHDGGKCHRTRVEPARFVAENRHRLRGR